MNCLKCEFHNASIEIKQVECIRCSEHEYRAHRYNCNELSNSGQVFESLDNHNPDYTDDRDIVTEIKRQYRESLRDASESNSNPAKHPAKNLSATSGVEMTSAAYDRCIDFIYALTSLNELALCLFFSTIKREEKSSFASRHNISPTKVNKLYWDLIATNPTLSNFILLTNGSLEGTRGRKPGQKNRATLARERGEPIPPNSLLPKSIVDGRMSEDGGLFQQMLMF